MAYQPFHVRVSNFSEKETNLRRGMIAAQRCQIVLWLTTVTHEWMHNKTVNTVLFFNSGTGKAVKVDQHLQFNKGNQERLEQN